MARTDLPRRFIAGSLLTATPAVVVLVGFAFYAIRSLIVVNTKLDEISQSIEETEDIRLLLTRGDAALHKYVFHQENTERQVFERTVGSIGKILDTCASAACHLNSIRGRVTPKMMTDRLKPVFEQWQRQGLSVFTQRPRPAGTEGAGRFQQLDDLERLAFTIEERLRIMRSAENTEASALRLRAYSASKQAFALIGMLALMAAVIGCAVALLLRRRSRYLEERVRERTAELKRKDEALLQSEKLASLGLLASGVAHELNNPLTSILMNTHLMMEDLGERSPVYGDLRKIDADTNRCKRIIDDLRAFSRHHPLDKVRCRVDEVIGKAVRLVEHELSLRGIRFEQELTPDFPEVLWDPERMAQMLTNLFINAAQAMERGGRLSVRADKADGRLVLEVRDTGAGIPKENRLRILDPFFTTKPDGTGLGLSISYGIIQEHGGQLEIESTTQGEIANGGQAGTTVRIFLPLSE